MENPTSIIVKKFLVKGILASYVFFTITMSIHATVLILWYSNFNGELNTTHWTILTTLGGALPILAHIMLGIVRSFKVLMASLYANLLKPKLETSIPLIIEKEKNKAAQSATDSSVRTANSIWDKIIELLVALPAWVKKPLFWILSKAGFQAEILLFSQTAMELSPEEIVTKLDDLFTNFVDNVKPFWISWIIPIHIALLIAIWFV